MVPGRAGKEKTEDKRGKTDFVREVLRGMTFLKLRQVRARESV